MAKDGFTQLIDDSNAFFTELEQNNSKDWFDPRKEDYIKNIRKPAEFLGEVLAEDFSRIAGATYQSKLFRIYRDVRFSKDKTPLKTHLHMLWRQPGDAPFAPVFFFGTKPEEMTTGFGVWGLKGDTLARFRRFIDGHGDALEDAIAQTGMTWANWGAAPLKRVPAPYDKEHPHGELLKKKGMTIRATLDDGWRTLEGGLVAALRAQFQKTLPLQQLIKSELAA